MSTTTAPSTSTTTTPAVTTSAVTQPSAGSSTVTPSVVPAAPTAPAAPERAANDVASLRKGIIKTTKHKKEMTILLVGETGVGKTSVLSLFANVLAGHSPDQYTDFEDKGNEQGGSQTVSQTNSAKLYEFKSQNGVVLRILDTPGLADTRGIAQDDLHKESIARAIQTSIVTINAVIILANGTNPRLSTATTYALTTLTSIFPRTLIDNIGLMFTNVATPTSWNFDRTKLDVSLRKSIAFPLDNPVAVNKKARELSQREGITDDEVEELRACVIESERKALKMLAGLFDWVDQRTPQPTNDIVSLYNKTQFIDQNLANALARMKASAAQQAKLQEIMTQLNKAKQDISYYQDKIEVETTVEVEVQVKTERHNTLCTGIADCRSNCHEGCGLDFALDQQQLADCWAMQPSGNVCQVCHHPRSNHKHFNVKWSKETQTQRRPDAEAIKALKDAGTAEAAQEQARKLTQQQIDAYATDIQNYTNEIARLAEEYSNLSLSGSFASQVEKSVELLDFNIKKMQTDGQTPSETIDQVKACRDSMQAKLDLLKKARAAERKQPVSNGILSKLASLVA